MNYKKWLANKQTSYQTEIKKIDDLKAGVSSLSELALNDYNKNEIIRRLTDRDYSNLNAKLSTVTKYLELINSGVYKKESPVKISIINKDLFKHSNTKRNLPLILSIINIFGTTKFNIINNENEDKMILTSDPLTDQEIHCVKYCIYNKLIIDTSIDVSFFEWDGEDVIKLNVADYTKDISFINIASK